MKSVLCLMGGFIGGFLAGFGIAKFYLKEKMEDEINAKINELEEYYEDVDKYKRKNTDDEETEDSEEIRDDNLPLGGRKNNIAYNKFKTKDVEEDDFDAQAVERVEELSDIRKSKKPPRIISPSAIGDSIPEEYDEEELIFWYYDSTLTDEDENLIDDPEILIGDSLYKYGFADTEKEDEIWVANFELEKVYHIVKEYANFTLANVIKETEEIRNEEKD